MNNINILVSNLSNSLDEIFWESLGQAILNMIEYSDSNLDRIDDSEEKLYLLLSNMIDFSFQHPSWYRLIWLEHIKGEPSNEVFEVIKNGSEKFNEKIFKSCNNKIGKKKAEEIADILNEIFAKLDKGFAAELYKSYLSFATSVAKSSGGVLGYAAVSPEEERLLGLSMINDPAGI